MKDNEAQLKLDSLNLERNKKLQLLIRNESTNFNLKCGLNCLMLLLLFLTSLFRGNGKNPSVVGVTKCKPNDHIIFASLLLGGIILTVIGGIVVQREYKKKVEL
jgi:hypothetical protein